MHFDHVEVSVPDRFEAAKWYESALGFKILDEYRDWAKEGGPLMISCDGGDTKIALFERDTDELMLRHGLGLDVKKIGQIGIRRLAVRTTGNGFSRFILESGDWRDPPLSRNEVQDHDKSISVYFTDPYGNPLEVTTYEHDIARQTIRGLE